MNDQINKEIANSLWEYIKEQNSTGKPYDFNIFVGHIDRATLAERKRCVEIIKNSHTVQVALGALHINGMYEGQHKENFNQEKVESVKEAIATAIEAEQDMEKEGI